MSRPIDVPTDRQAQDALEALFSCVEGRRLKFKVGRVALPHWAGLPHAERYREAVEFERLVIVPCHKIEILERIAIKMAWSHFPRRCLNRQEGSGGLSQHPDHVLYVAFFPRDYVSPHDDYVVLA